MKQNKLTMIGYAAGLFIIVSSTVRWFWLMPDYSQLVMALGIGVIVLGGAYVYQRLRTISEEIIEIKNRVDNIGTLVSKLEWQKA